MAQYSAESAANANVRERAQEKERAITLPTVREKRGPVDMPFLILVLVILSIGVIMVFSASFPSAYYEKGKPLLYFTRQLRAALIGVAAMLFISRLPVKLFKQNALWLLLGSIALLAITPIAGLTDNGATRWLGVGSLTFQPSEIAKIAVIIYFADVISDTKKEMRTFRYGVLPFVIVLAVMVGLLMLEPHMSAAIIIIAIGAVMMFVGGTRLGWFIGGGAGVAGLGYLFIKLTGYNGARLTVWRDPYSDRLGKGWQIIQSLYSIGSGGLLGLGFGQSRQKYMYLPEEHNDYIFSIFCEEMGFIGAMLLLLLFALLIIRGYWLALHARDRFGSLVITGVTTLLAIQVILNVLVATNTIPSTGISLPFFSYGGTALLIQMAEMGVVLSVSRDIPLRRARIGEGEEKK